MSSSLKGWACPTCLVVITDTETNACVEVGTCGKIAKVYSESVGCTPRLRNNCCRHGIARVRTVYCLRCYISDALQPDGVIPSCSNEFFDYHHSRDEKLELWQRQAIDEYATPGRASELYGKILRRATRWDTRYADETYRPFLVACRAMKTNVDTATALIRSGDEYGYLLPVLWCIVFSFVDKEEYLCRMVIQQFLGSL